MSTRALHVGQDRVALQKIENQLAYSRSQREIASLQLQKVREQLSTAKADAEVARSLRGAEQQLLSRINFFDTEGGRLDTMLRNVSSPPDTSAQLRALRLQSGQMFAAIKALSANITKLTSDSSKLDANGARQLQLLKQQRQNVNMQLHRVRAQIQTIDSHRQAQPADSGRAEYTDLMGEDEKQQLVNIQRMQMHSDNPFIDDYYYVMHTRRLTNLPITMRTPQHPQAGPEPNADPAAAPRPTSLHFEKTLGAVTYGSTRTPRALVSIENTDQLDASVPVSADVAWREASRAVETAYSSVLRLEDIDRLAMEPGMDRRPLFEQRMAILIATLTALGMAGGNSPRDAAIVNYILGSRKGVRLLGRLTPFLAPDQFVLVLSALMRSSVAPEAAMQQSFGNPAIAKISELQLPSALTVIKTFLDVRMASPTTLPLNDFQAILLYFIVRRAEAIVQHPTAPGAKELDMLVDPLVQRLQQGLAGLLGERYNAPVWQLVLTLIQHVSPPTRSDLAVALTTVLDRDGREALPAMVRQRLGV